MIPKLRIRIHIRQKIRKFLNSKFKKVQGITKLSQSLKFSSKLVKLVAFMRLVQELGTLVVLLGVVFSYMVVLNLRANKKLYQTFTSLTWVFSLGFG